MAKRLFLHIGAMKSGTSYLQALCTENQDRLEAAGVRWVRGVYHERERADQILRTGHKPPKVDAMCKTLSRAAQGWDGDLLVSMELLNRHRRPDQRRMIEAADVEEAHVIVSGRDLSRVIPSRWQTAVRNRQTWSWPEYVESVCSDDPDATAAGRTFWAQQDLAQMLRRWSSVAEPRRLHVVTVPASSSDRLLVWRRFAEILGIDPAGYREPKAGRSNPSRGLAAAEVLRRVNMRVDDLTYPVYRRGIGGPASQLYESAPGGEPRLQVPAAHRGWVDKRARRMNDEITELGATVVGDLAELLPGPPDPDAVESVEVSHEQLLETALDGLAGVGRMLAVVRLENSALRHRHDLPEAELDLMRGSGRRRKRHPRALVRRLRLALRR